MPKDPILARFSYYVKRRGRPVGNNPARDRDPQTMYILHDWNAVNTNLGAMWEPRLMMQAPIVSIGLANIDADEIAFNSMTEIDDNAGSQFSDGCHGGIQLPYDYNAAP